MDIPDLFPIQQPQLLRHLYRRPAVALPGEIDFVAERTDGAVLPVEIKFRRRIDDADFAALARFMEKHDRDNVQWPLMCRAVLCIDEQAWAGRASVRPLSSMTLPRTSWSPSVVVTISGDRGGDQYGTDQRKPPAT